MTSRLSHWSVAGWVAGFVLGAVAHGAGPADTKPPATAPSRVVAVTIYQGNALVTREVDIPAAQGLIEVIVSPLPPQTIDSSLYSEGSDGTRVMTTRYRTRAVREDTRAEVRTLQDQIKKLQAEQQRLQKDVEVAQQNLTFYGKLEEFTAVTMKTLADKGVLSGDTVVTISKHVITGRSDVAARQVELQQSIQANQEAIEFAERQLNEISAGSNRTERDAVIVLDKANRAPAKVTLHYLVGAASWRPQYKLRAGSEKDQVQVEYLAAIEQQSGEDWTNADVTLSTAQPMLNAAPPELLAMEITIGRRGGSAPTVLNVGARNLLESQRLRQRAQMDFNTNNSYTANTTINQAGALEQTEELLNPENRIAIAGANTYTGGTRINAGQFQLGAANEQMLNAPGQQGAPQQSQQQELVDQQQATQMQQDAAPMMPVRLDGPSVVYHLKNKLTIPSRNDEQLVEVARIPMTPDYFYKAIPVLAAHVYRQASLTNKSEHVLLPGEATMYVGKDFVGRMQLPLVAIGEQFVAGFGVDPQVQVARQMVSKTRSVQGGNQVHAYEYRLRISSYKPGAIKLQLWDRIPKADAEAVGVTLAKTTPELSSDPQYVRDEKPDNLLRWDLTIEPGMTQEKAREVTYQFKLEYARDVRVGNLRPAPPASMKQR